MTDYEELCRHEMLIGTCADCNPDGSLRRQSPAAPGMDDGRRARASDRTTRGSGPIFPASYAGVCASDDPHRIEVGDLIQWTPDGYVCEDHAEVGL